MADQSLSYTGPKIETVTTVDEIGPPPKSYRLQIIRWTSIVVVLFGWEFLGRQVNPLFMSYPTAIIHSAIHVLSTGELQHAFFESIRTLLLGFTTSSILGIALGFSIGRYRTVEASTDWLINALYSTPRLAIIPLVTLWFGLGFQAKLFIVFITVVFPVMINTIAGVQNVPANLLELAEAFGASEIQIFKKIIFPSALPYIMTGLRLGVGRGIIAMVVAEFFTAITGLGKAKFRTKGQAQPDPLSSRDLIARSVIIFGVIAIHVVVAGMLVGLLSDTALIFMARTDRAGGGEAGSGEKRDGRDCECFFHYALLMCCVDIQPWPSTSSSTKGLIAYA